MGFFTQLILLVVDNNHETHTGRSKELLINEIIGSIG